MKSRRKLTKIRVKGYFAKRKNKYIYIKEHYRFKKNIGRTLNKIRGNIKPSNFTLIKHKGYRLKDVDKAAVKSILNTIKKTQKNGKKVNNLIAIKFLKLGNKVFNISNKENIKKVLDKLRNKNINRRAKISYYLAKYSENDDIEIFNAELAGIVKLKHRPNDITASEAYFDNIDTIFFPENEKFSLANLKASFSKKYYKNYDVVQKALLNLKSKKQHLKIRMNNKE